MSTDQQKLQVWFKIQTKNMSTATEIQQKVKVQNLQWKKNKLKKSFIQKSLFEEKSFWWKNKGRKPSSKEVLLTIYNVSTHLLHKELP